MLEDHSNNKTAMARFLSSFGLSDVILKIIVANYYGLAFSGLINLLRTLEDHEQFSLCSILGKLTIVDDPTDITGRILKLLRKKLILKDIFNSRREKINLSPETFVEVLEILTQLPTKQDI